MVVQKVPLVVEQACGEVTGHGTPAESRLRRDVCVSVKLGKELFDGQQVKREHQSLVAVVAGAEVAFPEGVSQSQLSRLLAITEDAELGFS